MFNKIKTYAATASIAATLSMGATAPAQAGDSPWIGEVITVGFNFCPRGWAKMEGQLLPISQQTALFSLLGTTYGGDGRTTFGLPDTRSRATVGVGTGNGLTNYTWGQTRGVETNAINMPAHTHDTVVKPMANSGIASRTNPVGAFQGQSRTEKIYILDEDNIVEMSPDSILVTESSRGTTNTTESNIQPVLALTQCIALQGTFPSRN